MANRTGKKGKKPLQTTLGKANSQIERDMDFSHIQKPINTSIFGLRQVLSLFQTATQEVQNYITYECDIMYECRTCRTIFRSLANFILHKRDYCRERFNHLDLLNNNEECQDNTCSKNAENDESPQLSSDNVGAVNLGTKKGLLPVIERLKEKQEICQLAQEVINQDLSSKDTVEDSNDADAKNKHNDLFLEEIATNNAAVFQTVVRKLPHKDIKKPEFMKSEVMEIHGILDSDEAVLGPDGKICTFETEKINENPIIPKNGLFCTECNLKFSTKKTLTYHIKYKHNNTRLVYVCPDCKDTFANAWCVYRHLYKIHRRTSAQIKRMREQIHNSCVRKDQEPVKKKDKKSFEKVDKTDEENQWLSNIEGDNDFQMCGGCGKRFERKAALHSHAQMCTKRIAVCNTIKENNAKKKEEEVCKDSKSKTSKTERVEVLKGSSKRKPYLLRTYKSNEGESHDKIEGSCDLNANCEIIETNCDEPARPARHSLSSSEDLFSPSKKNFISSPSIEKIDTEKMFHIIGIPNYENGKNEDTRSCKGLTDDEASNVQQDGSKEEVSRSHTASDFDLFCQSVVETLFTDPLSELEETPQKPTKTIPLILRRRKNSSKSEKRNTILDCSGETSTNDPLKEKKTEVEKSTSAKIAQTNDADEPVPNPSSTSNFRISVKNLEELIGVSPQDHKKNSENRKIDAGVVTNISDHGNIVHFGKCGSMEVSDTLRANLSPEKLRSKYPKCLKRKRTASFEFPDCNRFSKISKRNFLSNKQNASFISKAAPFMDQNNLLCKPCQTTYPALSKLLWHMSAHFSWFRFQCSRCSFVSFNKMDCANHARKVHFVKKATIQSVVLPIPNWKTILMSHDFCVLDDENDFSGKHTDEILSGSLEDDDVDIAEDSNEIAENSDCDEWSDKLFVESEGNPEYDPLEPDILPEHSIKQENIDVIENNEESFQIEVPQEMYTLNVSEIIEGVNYEERCRCGTQIKMEPNDDEDDNDINSYLPTNEVNSEPTSDFKTNDKLFNDEPEDANNFEDRDCFGKNSGPIINLRPTRNRTRSIKTIQDDFFYDLSKVIKLNDTSMSKSNLQKHKKSASQKNTKDANSSNGKSDAQQIRVYAKKK